MSCLMKTHHYLPTAACTLLRTAGSVWRGQTIIDGSTLGGKSLSEVLPLLEGENLGFPPCQGCEVPCPTAGPCWEVSQQPQLQSIQKFPCVSNTEGLHPTQVPSADIFYYFPLLLNLLPLLLWTEFPLQCNNSPLPALRPTK